MPHSFFRGSQIIMPFQNVVLQSAGSLSVAILALVMLILQTVFFIRRTECRWYAWSACISFSALLYSVAIFIEYNTAPVPMNRFSGLMEFTAIICLIHCLYGFTFSYFGMDGRAYHRTAGAFHGVILILMWSSPYIVARDFTARRFMGLDAPFVEPALGPLGPFFVLYAGSAAVAAMVLWMRRRETDPKHRNAFLAGMGVWVALGIHDGLAALGVPAFQYMMEYGFLAFATVVLWVVFSSYLEAAAEEKYRVITELANDCILVIQEGKLVFGNPACGRLLGHSPGESAAVDFLDIMVPEDRKRALEHYESLMQTGRADQPLTIRIRNGDGEPWVVEITSSVIRYRNRPAVLAIMRDVTERNLAEQERDRLQEQLLHSQKMESVGRLAGGVAHDFNNMLGVIIGHAEMARDEAAPDSPQHESLREILKAAARSADVASQLLAFARKQTIDPKVLDLNRNVEGMLKVLKRLIGEDIDVAWRPQDDLWPVRMDPAQMYQILANLCVNARDAIAGTGTITIETKNAPLQEDDRPAPPERRPGEYVMLAVCDDGCGMEADVKSRLFEPFFTTKDVGKGTGLGLSTVYGIVRQNGGFIEVLSEPGKGAAFQIYLPRHSGEPESAAEEKAENAPRGRGETILLVEDESAVLEVGRKILERLGYAVLAAGAPGAALELAREHPGDIDLLLTDVVMPQMNGIDLAEQITAVRPALKTMFMSGYTDEAIVRHGIVDQGTPFLSKPFTPEGLARKVRDTLSA